MRARLPLRLTRTAAFAAVCVTLAALAHLLGGGAAPGPWAAGLGLGAASLLGLALCGRERSTATVNTVLAVAQLGLHELFATDGATYVGAYVTAHAHGQGLGVQGGMLLAHLTATLITGLWLSRGEAALWALLRRLGVRLTPLRPALVPAVPPVTPVVLVRDVPVDPLFRHSVARRGPPLPA
ncbi:MFS transporter [Nonomuraea sp. NPDC005983]|uniref:MFS transporter n=1 Tax=Nonomuraea sp. NPDC005983 TaxID=3155595 RepID=UPI0033B7546B